MVSARLFALGLTAVSAHPIQRVVKLLEELKVKAKEEGELETIEQTKFSRWCGNTVNEYTDKVAANKETIGSLEEKIEGLTKSIAGLDEAITEGESDIANRDASMSDARALRSDEKSAYENTAKNLGLTIDAVTDALNMLVDARPSLIQKAKSQVKKVAMFMQPFLNSKQNNVFKAFLQAEPNKAIVAEAGRERVYDFKSNGVIELLKKMQAAFKQQATDTDQAETHAVNSHDLAMQAAEAAQEAAQKALSANKKERGQAGEAKAKAESDLSEEQGDLESNTTMLNDTKNTCRNRNEEYEARMQSRADEIAAINTAVDILTPGKVFGGIKGDGVRNSAHESEDTSYNTFLQVSGDDNSNRSKAAALIMKIAKQQNNATLKLLSQRVKKATGPFKQIINQIQKMVFQLNKEQTDEDNHKNWCDNELQTTQADHAVKKDSLKTLAEKVAALQAEIEELALNIKGREENIAQKQADFKEASEQNTTLKKDLAVTVADAKNAQGALTSALAALQKYYGENASLVQEPDMSAHSGAFTNTSGSAKVLSLLQTTLADYSKMEAEAIAQDEERETTFQEFKKQTEIAINKDETVIKAKTARKGQQSKALAFTQKKEKKTQKQFDAINQYLADLEPNCGSGSDEDEAAYTARRSARDSEIAALKQAEKLLGNAFSFLARN